MTSDTIQQPAPGKAPVEAAYRALAQMAVDGMGGKAPSNPGELAAAGGDAPKTPTASQWSDADAQAAQTYLGRFQVPLSVLEGKITPEEGRRLAKGLEEMQKGIHNAKTKAQARISELEQLNSELSAAVARKAEPKVRNTEDDARKAAIKEIAEELGGDASKIGPALERLIATSQPKESAPAAPQSDVALQEVRGLAIESARTQLQGTFPGLQHDALYAEVLSAMESLAGPRYDSLPTLAQRESARMRDASLLVFGASAAGVGPNQTPARSPGSSVPRPDGRSDAKPVQQSPLEIAQTILDKAGLR